MRTRRVCVRISLIQTMTTTDDIFLRNEMLYGSESCAKLARARVIIFGLGGVGSWCAEALARSGVGEITLVDADLVEPSNINRQLPALTSTVGIPKAEALAQRLRDINPGGTFIPVVKFYDAQTADEFDLTAYDVVIDAIDSLSSKAMLILRGAAPRVRLFSSMGAAQRIDPSRVQEANFWNVKGCPLARALRDKFHREGTKPERKFRCVYSDEAPVTDQKGSSVIVTATFGMRLASMVLARLIRH